MVNVTFHGVRGSAPARVHVGARRVAARLSVDEVITAAEGTTVSLDR